MLEKITCALIAICLAASGCTLDPIDSSSWVEPGQLGRELNTVRPSYALNDEVSDETYVEPVGSLSLRDALVAALMGSPNLAAIGYEVRAREAEILQAGFNPNPIVAVEWENFGGSGELETTLALSQLVELGGKRTKRMRIAQFESAIAGWDYEIRRIDVLTKTATDYIGLLASKRRHRIATEILELAKSIFNVVGERVEAGKISPIEQSKSRVELAKAELGSEQARRAVEAARIRLAANWGSTTPKFTHLSGNLDLVDSIPQLHELLERVQQNPDLARWSAQVALRQAEVELALAQRAGDITVTGGVRYFDDGNDSAFVAGISIPLSIFDGNQGNIHAARFRTMKENRLKNAAQVQVRTAVVAAFQRLDTSFVSVSITKDQILPSAEISFEAAEVAFRQGKIGALSLLDTERTLFDARRQLTNSLTSYHLAVIACERLIGAPLHAVDQYQGNDE